MVARCSCLHAARCRLAAGCQPLAVPRLLLCVPPSCSLVWPCLLLRPTPSYLSLHSPQLLPFDSHLAAQQCLGACCHTSSSRSSCSRKEGRVSAHTHHWATWQTCIEPPAAIGSSARSFTSIHKAWSSSDWHRKHQQSVRTHACNHACRAGQAAWHDRLEQPTQATATMQLAERSQRTSLRLPACSRAVRSASCTKAREGGADGEPLAVEQTARNVAVAYAMKQAMTKWLWSTQMAQRCTAKGH